MALSSCWLFLVIAGCERHERPAAVSSRDAGVLFAEKPAARPVPRGLKGLSFGMTVEEAGRVLPELGAAGADPEPDVLTDWNRLSVERHLGGDPTGSWLSCRTPIGTENATCILSFAVEKKLSAMTCLLDKLKTAEAHRAVEKTLLETLIRSYGPPAKSPADEAVSYGSVSEKTWTWQDQGARLELRTELGDAFLFTSEILICNESAEHLALVRSILEKQEREQQLREQEEERRREQELQRVKDQARSFEKDL